MTARVFVTLLMLAQVLACPFLECGECRGACAVQCIEANDACDDCCKADSGVCEHEPGPCDDPACPNNSGPLDCLCGGAVQTDVVECPDLLAGGEFFAFPEAAQSHASVRLVAKSSELTFDGCPHFPPLITGTSICALTQTYLL